MSGLTIGDLSARTGLAVSAIRFYETRGIVRPVRNQGGHRRYSRSDIRRLSFAMIAQKLGFSLSEISDALAGLPDHRAPSKADWTRLSRTMRDRIEDRIDQLGRLRDQLDSCIGCGCLSLETCVLHNPDDQLGAEGPGPRKLLRD